MPTTIAKGFSMDRRSLLKLTGTYGIGSMFINPEQLFAQDKCEFIITDNGEIKAQQSIKTLQFWIDGMHLVGPNEKKEVENFSDLPSRANITLWMDIIQSPIEFVESVVLMDDKNQTLGARFFDNSMKMVDGRVPYVCFENIALDHTKDYKVVYTVRNGNGVKLWTATLSKPTLSRFNTTWFNDTMRDDFANFLNDANQTNLTPGLITTPYQSYTLNSLQAHSARGKFLSIGSDGDFECAIDFMHGDVDDKHYMRYFIVMDPVGRLLGFKKRKFGDGRSGSVTISKENTPWEVDNEFETGDKKFTFNVAQIQRADIRDCPWVQVFTEDYFDAVARTIIRLR